MIIECNPKAPFFNCTLCVHCDNNRKTEPCNACAIRIVDKVPHYLVTGQGFEPKDPEYMTRLRSFCEEYNRVLDAAEDFLKNTKSDINRAAKEYGVDIDTFYFFRRNFLKRYSTK